MKKYILWSFLIIFLTVGNIAAQNGSQHGVMVTWTAPNPIGGSGALQGYQLFRCPGTCANSSPNWTAVSPVITSTFFLDTNSGASAPQTGQAYSYAVLDIDSNGNMSTFSNIAGVSIPSSWPSNPGAPAGCNARVQ